MPRKKGRRKNVTNESNENYNDKSNKSLNKKGKKKEIKKKNNNSELELELNNEENEIQENSNELKDKINPSYFIINTSKLRNNNDIEIEENIKSGITIEAKFKEKNLKGKNDLEIDEDLEQNYDKLKMSIIKKAEDNNTTNTIAKINNKISKEEYKIYIQEYKKYNLINTYFKITEQENIKTKKETKHKLIKNTREENLSMSDALEDLEKEEKNGKSDFKNISLTNDEKHKNELIIIKGNTIQYNKRIFIYNHNASKYQAKKNRKIYHCQYRYHLINKLIKKHLPPFCNMKITYYPDNAEGEQFKITGDHSYDYIKKFNEERSDKKKY